MDAISNVRMFLQHDAQPLITTSLKEPKDARVERMLRITIETTSTITIDASKYLSLTCLSEECVHQEMLRPDLNASDDVQRLRLYGKRVILRRSRCALFPHGARAHSHRPVYGVCSFGIRIQFRRSGYSAFLLCGSWTAWPQGDKSVFPPTRLFDQVDNLVHDEYAMPFSQST